MVSAVVKEIRAFVGGAVFENLSFQSSSLPTLRCLRCSDIKNRAKTRTLSHRIIS